MDVPKQDQPDMQLVDGVSYRTEAVSLVSKGYRSIVNELENLKKFGLVPNEGLRVIVADRLRHLKPLLSAADLQAFQAHLGFHDTETVVKAIWHILENVCGDHTVVPAITIAPESGEVIVILHA